MIKKTCKCIICGTEYESCNCNSNVKPYSHITCSMEHYQLYMVLNDYSYKNITKTEARQIINKLNLGSVTGYPDNIKDLILEINKIERKKENIKVAEKTTGENE